MSNLEYQCEEGCQHFSCGSIKHHRDCANYPDSMSFMIDELRGFIEGYLRPTIKELRQKNEDLHIDLAIYRITDKKQSKQQG